MKKLIGLVAALIVATSGCGGDEQGDEQGVGDTTVGGGQGVQGVQRPGGDTSGGGRPAPGFYTDADAAKGTAAALYGREYETLYENATSRWKSQAGSAERFEEQIRRETTQIGSTQRRKALPEGEITIPPDGYTDGMDGSKRAEVTLGFTDPENNFRRMEIDLVLADDRRFLIDGFLVRNDKGNFKFGSQANSS